MAWMNEEGDYRGPSTFRTSGENLRKRISDIKAEEKALTLEEGPLAFWTARVLDGLVDRTVVCDPRENYLISRAARKDDEADVKALARLLRKLSLREKSRKFTSRRAIAVPCLSRPLGTTLIFGISAGSSNRRSRRG